MEMIRDKNIARSWKLETRSVNFAETVEYSVSESFPQGCEVSLHLCESSLQFGKPSCPAGRGATPVGLTKCIAGKVHIAAGRPEAVQGRGKLMAGSTKTATGRTKTIAGIVRKRNEECQLMINDLGFIETNDITETTNKLEVRGSWLKVKNASRSSKRLKVSPAIAAQPLGVLQTLKVSVPDSTRTPFNSLKGAGAVGEIISTSWRTGGSIGMNRRGNDECRIMINNLGFIETNDITETTNKLNAKNIQFPIFNDQYFLKNKKQEIGNKKSVQEVLPTWGEIPSTRERGSKNDEYPRQLKHAGQGLTIEDLGSGLKNENRFEAKDITEIKNKLATCDLKLAAQNINPISLVTGKRTVANNLKQSSAYET